MNEKIRYVEARQRASGKVAYYWHRRGHAVVRLPDDAAARFAMQRKLNNTADAKQTGKRHLPALEGSITWVVERYLDSDRYGDLAGSSKTAYSGCLRVIQHLWGDILLPALSRRAVVDFLDGVPSVGMKRIYAACLKNLWGVGAYYGVVQMGASPVTDLRLSTPAPRSEIWKPEDCAKFATAAQELGAPAWLMVGFNFCRYSAQRIGDVRKLTRANLKNGTSLALTQTKTSQPVEFRLHRALLPVLASLTTIYLVAHVDGRPVPEGTWETWFRRVRAHAGLNHLHLHDLRRTAVLEMRLAGVSLDDISKITGHSVRYVKVLCDTYLPAHPALASAAIGKWEDWGGYDG